MASLYSDTITNVLQMVSDYRGESATDTSSSRVRAVSRQERALAKRRLWRLFNIKNQTTTGTGNADYTIGTSTYNYRNKGLSELFVGGTTEDKRYTIVDFQKYKNLVNQNTAARLVYEWYDVANDLWKIHINPAPETGVTITYSHFWLPAKKTSASDTVYCLDMEALARYALAEIYEAEDEDDKANGQRQIAEQILNEEAGWEDTPNVGQIIQIDAIENQIKPMGIGSY